MSIPHGYLLTEAHVRVYSARDSDVNRIASLLQTAAFRQSQVGIMQMTGGNSAIWVHT